MFIRQVSADSVSLRTVSGSVCFVAGFVFFSVHGFMAHQQGVTVDAVAESGTIYIKMESKAILIHFQIENFVESYTVSCYPGNTPVSPHRSRFGLWLRDVRSGEAWASSVIIKSKKKKK